MRYEQIECGLRVRVPDGREGKVLRHDHHSAFSFGGGFVTVPPARRMADVEFDDGTEGRFPIPSLKMA